MADPKTGYRMEYLGGEGIYDVLYHHQSFGRIVPWDGHPGQWMFYPKWSETQGWSGESLSECKKKAKQAHKGWLKSQK